MMLQHSTKSVPSDCGGYMRIVARYIDPYDPRERQKLIERYNELTGPVRTWYAPRDEIERMIRRG
jgi:hypothetical protein